LKFNYFFSFYVVKQLPKYKNLPEEHQHTNSTGFTVHVETHVVQVESSGQTLQLAIPLLKKLKKIRKKIRINFFNLE
jgi:hypothetical protein